MFVCVLWSQAGPGSVWACWCVLVLLVCWRGTHGAAPTVWLSHNIAVVAFVLGRQQRRNACIRQHAGPELSAGVLVPRSTAAAERFSHCCLPPATDATPALPDLLTWAGAVCCCWPVSNSWELHHLLLLSSQACCAAALRVVGMQHCWQLQQRCALHPATAAVAMQLTPALSDSIDGCSPRSAAAAARQQQQARGLCRHVWYCGSLPGTASGSMQHGLQQHGVLVRQVAIGVHMPAARAAVTFPLTATTAAGLR